jgi:glycine/D-amino acid oxidase-like deaminating enzyme/nitrite reductase/ring-hydroxylating ferredoxin subunit
MINRDGALPSVWQATTTRTKDISSRLLPDNATFDVVIVGGGITGVTTGLLLQEAGFRCILLEANSLCFGTTGGTTAHLNTLLDTPYPTIIRNFGHEKAARVAQAVKDSIQLAQANCVKYSIDANFEYQTAWLFSQDEEQTKQLEEIRVASEQAGLHLGYTAQMPAEIPMQKALAVYDQAKFHPTRYVQGLARAFQEMGGRVIEQCRVTDADNSEKITVHTALGDIACTYLIYATHIPPGVNILHTRCAPYRSYAMAVTLKGSYPDGLLYDMYDPYHYIRTQVIDGQPYLIGGGEDHKTGHVTNTETCFLNLESYLRKNFPVDEVKYKWSSQYFESVDGLPYIGHLPGVPDNTFVATGFGGNGMVYSGVAAMLFRDILVNSSNSSDNYLDVFDPNRIKPIAGFTNFVRENADVAKSWIGKLLPADKLDSFADMAPGEGRVVKVEKDTIALYKNEEGELLALSPTCPHMGCHVTWNNMERSWDCPCHGARYSPDGAMLTGPSSKDLERIRLEELLEK